MSKKTYSQIHSGNGIFEGYSRLYSHKTLRIRWVQDKLTFNILDNKISYKYLYFYFHENFTEKYSIC